jgi:type II secretory pathway component HofQ
MGSIGGLTGRVTAGSLHLVKALVLALLCTRGVAHHGAPIDLDVKDADIHDVFRLLADVGHVNLVVSDEVTGKITLRLKHVAWDAAACTIADMKHLDITVQDNILLVKPRH